MKLFIGLTLKICLKLDCRFSSYYNGGGGGFTPKNSILNFSNLVDRRKLKFGQNIKLSMPYHIMLHWMHLLYIYKSYLRKIDFSTYYYWGGFTPTRHNSFLSNIFWPFMILIVFYTYFWPIKAFKSVNITLEVPEIKMGMGVKTPPPSIVIGRKITWGTQNPVFIFRILKTTPNIYFNGIYRL